MYRDTQLYCRLRDDLRAVPSWRRGSPRSWHGPGAAGVTSEETAAW